MVDLDVVVAVPWLAFAVPDLDETNAAFEQTPGDQELARLCPLAIHFANVFRLARDVEGIGRVQLHPVGQLKGLDARLQLRVVAAFLAMSFVERVQQVELGALFGQRDVIVLDVLDEIFRSACAGCRCKCLERRRAKTRIASSVIPGSDIRVDTWR